MKNFEFADYFNNLELDNGIYKFSRDALVSYPESGYDRCFAVEESSFWFRHRNKVIENIVRPSLNDGEFLLDVGGGNGAVTKYLEDRGVSAVLLEPGAAAVRNAKARGVSHVIQATLEPCLMRPGRVAFAGAFDVVEHVEDDIAFVRSIVDALKPRGKFLMLVPAHQFLWSGSDVRAGHYRRYTTRSASELMRVAGLQVIYSTYLFCMLPIPLFCFRTLPYRMGISRASKSNENIERQHGKQHPSLLRKGLDSLLNWEYRQVVRRQRITMGSSVLVLGEKLP